MSFLLNPFVFGGGGGGWLPTDLASLAWWFDPSDLSTMWQDIDRTVACAVDSRVGAIEDKSGNGRHLQSVSTVRPILRLDASGNYYLEFAGAQAMNSYGGDTNVPCSTVIVAAQVNTGTEAWTGLVTNSTDQAADVDVAFLKNDTAASWYIGQAAGGGLSDATHIWNNQVQTAVITVDSPRVYSADGTGHPATARFPSGLRIGDDRTLSNRDLSGRVYGLIGCSAILSADDRNDAEAYLAGKAGVTL